jgi:hypothetical protein
VGIQLKALIRNFSKENNVSMRLNDVHDMSDRCMMVVEGFINVIISISKCREIQKSRMVLFF